MKKIYALIAAFAAIGMVACTAPVTPDPEPDPEPAAEPVAAFEYAVEGLKVTFTNKSENAVGYKWEFGDEETSKEANPTHEYAAAGEYTVKLTAANADGVTSKKEAVVKLSAPVKAYFSATAIEGRDGEFGKALQFDASSSANAVSIAWDFGDGSSSTEFTVKHVFPGFGKYTVKATVKGEAGDTDVYSQEVETVKATQVIKGGSMEADDKDYWEVAPLWGYDAGQYVGVEGVYAYAPVFGSTDVNLGHGGCYKFESNPLGWDFNNKGCVYQGIDVREGDKYDIDCLVKWGAETQDNGHFTIRVCYDEWTEGTIIFRFNNWWGVHDPTDEEKAQGVERSTVWLPAFEGNIAQCVEAMGEYGCEVNAELAELVDGKVRYTATKTGKLYICFFVNQVWGYAFGAGRDIYLDEVTANAVVE